MAPPSMVMLRLRDIHAALVQAGWVGKKFPREEMEAYLTQELGMSLPNVRVHIDQGRAMGLWSLIDRRPRPGALLVLAPKTEEVSAGVTDVHATA